MKKEQAALLGEVANSIRVLSMDAVQKANSGHPGLPLGCAELGAYLYGHFLKHNPSNPLWLNRDRVVLSAGHGSMWLYSCLHLSGFDLPLDELKRFRQLHSKTPGHPEYGETAGVETTTGPLGQGLATAVGQALGLKILAEKFNTKEHKIFDSKVIVVCGDGCMMEGITSEASSLAGHLGLDNLIVCYDSNKISLDGPLPQSCSEDTKARYQAYGWDVHEVDGNNLEDLDKTLAKVRSNQTKPCFIECHTIIGKGSPNKEGTHKVHGSPLGEEEVAATKKALGLPEEAFYVPGEVRDYFAKLQKEQAQEEAKWQETFAAWKSANPQLAEELAVMIEKKLPQDMEAQLQNLEMKDPIAGRAASNAVINFLADKLPYIYGGSADLSCSDKTLMDNYPLIGPKNFAGRNIKYGVREFAMGAMNSGLAQTQAILPYCGTFFTFSDYMRNAIRLAALMRVHVIYQFTHDSIFVGEDGPTHEPIEHLSSLRAMPNLHVIRPGDSHEVKMAWLSALRYQGPTAIVLTRQALPTLAGTGVSFEEGMAKGAYIVKKEKNKPDFTFFATGSELSLAMDVASELEKKGKDVRVISMPCWELFEHQSAAYKESIVGGDLGKRVSIEAGSELGWHKYIGSDGIAVSMHTFGASAPAKEIAKEHGFTVEGVLSQLSL